MRRSERASARDRRLRAAGDSGAALVEFALVVPILALLLFGIIDFGVGFSQLNSMRQGTREGARQGVVADFGGDSSCTTTGTAATGDTKELICLVKERVGLDDGNVRVRIHFPTTNDSGETMIVCSQYPLSSASGFLTPFLDNRTLRTKVEMRIEQEDSDLVATAETPHTGGWTWCA